MITNPRINGIRQQFVPVDNDAQDTVVVAVATSLAYAEVWVVARDGTARKIGRSEGTGKVDSAGARVFPDGAIRLWLCCADPGGSGSTSHTEYIDFGPDETQIGNWYALGRNIKDKILDRVADTGSQTHQTIQGIAHAEAEKVIQG